MNNLWRLLIAGALAAALLLMSAAQAAAVAGEVARMQLDEVIGRSVCPLVVWHDDDPLRLPRRIKYMRCARAATPCCRRRDVSAHCVEVYDNVVVQYLPHAGAPRSAAARRVVAVPVGCACVYSPGTAAATDD